MKITFTGNISKDAELKYAGEGDARYAFVNIWVAENVKRRDDVKKANWHRVTLWRKYAEVMAPYLKKGRRIHVEGTMQGVKTYTTDDNRIVPYADIWADSVELLDRPQTDSTVPPEVETEENPW